MNTEPINSLITSAIKIGMYPGAAISIGDKTGEFFRNYYGYRALFPKELPMEESTLFDLASLTKIVSTTMVTLALVESRKLSLESTLYSVLNGDYFDKHKHNDKKNITIHQLMTHTSGLPAHINLHEMASTPEDVYCKILEQSLSSKSGCKFEYTCLGFILLGKICEIIGGANLNELAHDYVFKPLGLKTATYNPCTKTYTFAQTKDQGELLNGVVHDKKARFMDGISGNAGVFADISDCSVLAKMFANGSNKNKIISPQLFSRAVKNHISHCDGSRGLGFDVKGRAPASCGCIFPMGSYGHTGFTGTSIWVDAETSQYVVFLTNRALQHDNNSDMLKFRSELHDCCAIQYRKMKE